MNHPSDLSQLLEFPCDYTFKAFGCGDGRADFAHAVHTAIATVLPVPLDAVKVRPSSKGSYVCVSVLVRLHNADQVKDVYAALKRVDGIKFLL